MSLIRFLFEPIIHRELFFKELPFFRHGYLYPFESKLSRVLRKERYYDSIYRKDGSFNATINVKDFTPQEITVKTVKNTLIVEGKHEERKDNSGFISRHFVRKYILPEGVDPESITSAITKEGILTVHAPPSRMANESKERIIPIQECETNDE